MSKHCEFCGRFFVPDHRVGNRQRACSRPDCKAARKQASQKKWVSGEPGYFHGRYPYVKEWRQKQRDMKSEVIQDERPPAKPLLKLVLVVPVSFRKKGDRFILPGKKGTDWEKRGQIYFKNCQR